VDIDELSPIDWAVPWLAPYRRFEAVSRTPGWRVELSRLAALAEIRTAEGKSIRFVPASAIDGAPYELHIAATGEIATRSNCHDFFNALAWLVFPQTKARLNALQAAAIAREGLGGRRGPVRDAATLIDENGLLLVTTEASPIDALRCQDWMAAFVSERGGWDAVRPLVFGHALLDKLRQPYKSVTAHAWVIAAEAITPLDEIDRRWAASLGSELTPRLLMPVPVLGIPGWCADNEQPSFYRDSTVFRPARSGRQMAAS